MSDNLNFNIEQAPIDFKKSGIQTGVALGLFYVGLQLVLYFAGIKAFAYGSFVLKFIPYFLIAIIVMFWKIRSKAQFIKFNDVLQYALIAYIIIEIFFAGFNWLLFNVIDPLLARKTIEAFEPFIKTQTALMPPAERKNLFIMLDNAKQNEGQSIKSTILGFGMQVVFNFIPSLICAAIGQKKQN